MNTKDQDSLELQPNTVGIVTEYIHAEIFTYDVLTYDDIAAVYVIDTEFLRDSFNTELADLHADTIIDKDSGIYYICTNHIFCAIVEISLCAIANLGNDIEYITDMVLEEQYYDGVSIREIVSTGSDIDGTLVISRLVASVYEGLGKYLASFSSETGGSTLVPLNWSYPDYQYLSIGVLYDY